MVCVCNLVARTAFQIGYQPSQSDIFQSQDARLIRSSQCFARNDANPDVLLYQNLEKHFDYEEQLKEGSEGVCKSHNEEC